MMDQANVVREDAALQSVGGIVDDLHRRLEIIVGPYGDDGPEYLLALHLHVGFRVGEHGGVDQSALAAVADQHTGPALFRLGDP